MKKRTGRDPAENEDNDGECDQYVDDFSHLATSALVVSDDEGRGEMWHRKASTKLGHILTSLYYTTN